jgi:hypothetical protein
MLGTDMATNLRAELGRDGFQEYMRKVDDPLKVFEVAYEDGRLSETLYQSYLSFRSETS